MADASGTNATTMANASGCGTNTAVPFDASSSSSSSSSLTSLFFVLLNIIILQAVGHRLKSLGTLTAEMQGGLGLFVGQLALPALLFHSMATLDVWAIDPAVLAAVLISKLCMVTIAVWLGFAAQQFITPLPGAAYLRGGILSLLATNGDELGLGLPAMGALFEPKLVAYLYVLAGFQECVLSPVAFVILGVGAATRDAAKQRDRTAPSTAAVLRAVLRHELRNPLVIAIMGGLSWNLLFARLGGAALPRVIDMATHTLGEGFPPCIFVLMGAASVGSFSRLASLDNVPLPLTVVLLKSLILPTLVRSLATSFGVRGEALDFCFAYGMLPAAGSTLVFASKYGPSYQQADLLNATLALSKMLSFPLLLLVSAVLFEGSPTAIRQVISRLSAPLQFVSLLLSVLTLVSSTCWHEPRPHVSLRLLFFLQCGFLFFALGAELLPPPWPTVARYQFGLVSYFRWASDMHVLSIALLHIHHLRELAEVEKGRVKQRGKRTTLTYGSPGVVHRKAAHAGGGGGAVASFAAGLRSTPALPNFAAGGGGLGSGHAQAAVPADPSMENLEARLPAIPLVATRGASHSTDDVSRDLRYFSMRRYSRLHEDSGGEGREEDGAAAGARDEGKASAPAASARHAAAEPAAASRHPPPSLSSLSPPPNPPNEVSLPSSLIHLAGFLVVSATAGLGLTLPWTWSASEGFPEFEFSDVWIPYGSGQALVFALVYVFLTVALLAALLVILRYDSELQLRESNEHYHCFIQRLYIILTVVITRVALSAAVCAAAAALDSPGGGFQPTGTIAVMLLVQNTLNNGFGVLLFFAFGWAAVSLDLIPMVAALQRWTARLAPRRSHNTPSASRRAEADDDDDDQADEYGHFGLTGFEESEHQRRGRSVWAAPAGGPPPSGLEVHVGGEESDSSSPACSPATRCASPFRGEVRARDLTRTRRHAGRGRRVETGDDRGDEFHHIRPG
jgi:predicted permease